MNDCSGIFATDRHMKMNWFDTPDGIHADNFFVKGQGRSLGILRSVVRSDYND